MLPMNKYAGNDGAGAAKKRRIEQDGDAHIVKILNMVRKHDIQRLTIL